MNGDNTNWSQSVTAVVIKDGKVLLGRHTYGGGAGKLIVPGGYCNFGESPIEAVKREYMEETKVVVEPKDIIAIRMNAKDWYVAFRADYVSGEPTSDNDENSEVIWLDVNEALERDDVPGLTKTLIKCALNDRPGMEQTDYDSNHKQPFSYLFSCK